MAFQSTLPVRGATQTGADHGLQGRDCKPRSPCGERPPTIEARLYCLEISIHAPRAGSDCRRYTTVWRMGHFNPRSPCGERPNLVFMSSMAISFQSTLPVRGATAGGCERMIAMLNFNPRSPCGERRFGHSDSAIPGGFQSTLPVRGATLKSGIKLLF